MRRVRFLADREMGSFVLDNTPVTSSYRHYFQSLSLTLDSLSVVHVPVPFVPFCLTRAWEQGAKNNVSQLLMKRITDTIGQFMDHRSQSQ